MDIQAFRVDFHMLIDIEALFSLIRDSTFDQVSKNESISVEKWTKEKIKTVRKEKLHVEKK
jgi:hypothetical protein